MKKKTHSKPKSNNKDYWFFVYIIVVIIVASIIYQNSKNSDTTPITEIEDSTPDANLDQTVAEKDTIVESIPEPEEESIQQDPVEETTISEPEKEIPLEEPVSEETLAIQECTNLCVGSEVENDFKRNECSATCIDVFEFGGMEKLNVLIEGLKR